MLLAQGKLIASLRLFAATTWASVRAIWAQTTALLANPFTAVAVAIAGVIALVVTLIRYWDELTWRFNQKFKNPLKDLTPEEQKKLDAYNKTHGTKIKNEIPGFASGTNYFSGGLALVGEKGPELVQLPSATKIYNNSSTVKMIGRMSQPRFNNVIDFGKYLDRRIEVKPAKLNQDNENDVNTAEVNDSSNGNNGGVLTIELIAPEGYQAKVVNARTSDGRAFKVKLRGKRRQ